MAKQIALSFLTLYLLTNNTTYTMVEEMSDQQATVPPSVGKEFILWAEQYWALRGAYEDRAKSVGAEDCQYDYIRMTFADKIDEILKSRLIL